MRTVSYVLLVHNEPDAFRGIEEMLKRQEIKVYHARKCAEARSLLRNLQGIDLVLTDVDLADGTWKDVIQLTRTLTQDTPVIVMSRVVSMRLYLDTQDGGAADFIVPPLAPRDLAYTLTTAMHRVPPAAIMEAAAQTHSDHRSRAPLH